ncbi:MAG: hypothetical protein U0992_08200 [Planctomycetaceae bacterium]
MSSDLAMPPAVEGSPGLEFYTVYIPLKQPTAFDVVPYVRAALETIGCGSVVAVGKQGLQLTAPIHLAHYLQATIEQHLNRAAADPPLPRFANNVFYPPLLIVPSTSRRCSRP